MGQIKPEMLPEDVETMLGKKRVTSSISRQTYTFSEVFYFSVKPPFKAYILDFMDFFWVATNANKWSKSHDKSLALDFNKSRNSAAILQCHSYFPPTPRMKLPPTVPNIKASMKIKESRVCRVKNPEESSYQVSYVLHPASCILHPTPCDLCPVSVCPVLCPVPW